ncbi:MAG TPA: hypothetical protein VK789_16260 [Bryobacteraceae bacterium]|nr:hypothetical protein [Bryobacteraceae bacterium]
MQERSLAAPDYACGVFAKRALAMHANGDPQKRAITRDNPLTRELTLEEMDSVVGGLHMVYPTVNRTW